MTWFVATVPVSGSSSRPARMAVTGLRGAGAWALATVAATTAAKVTRLASLDGATVARIYLGEIKSWDDAAIKKLNPNAKLPAQAIAPVYRSDGSGTTYNFTEFLSSVSPEWRDSVGFNTSVSWKAGIGARGSSGVAGVVRGHVVLARPEQPPGQPVEARHLGEQPHEPRVRGPPGLGEDAARSDGRPLGRDAPDAPRATG